MNNPAHLFPVTKQEPFFAEAWDRALTALKPSNADLEHGLALHRQLRVIDNYGFLPRIWTQETVDFMNDLVDEGVGIRAWSQRSTAFRLIAATRDQRGGEEFCLALQASGLRGMIVPLSGADSTEDTLSSLATHQQVLRTFHRDLANVGSVEELDAANDERKIGCIWSITGPPAAGSMSDPDEKLEWIDTWYQLGIRLMHLSYNRRNVIADGCTESNDGGVSDFGAEFIQRMNRAGIVVDVPHSSSRTLMHACKISKKPVMASHAGCRRVFDHPRCKSDEELKAIAGTDGLVGIYAVPSLLGPNADLSLMMAHVSHAVKTIGADHVAIGTDLGHQKPFPPEIRDYHTKRDLQERAGGWKPEHSAHFNEEHLGGSLSWVNWPLFTVGLVKMGLNDQQIAQILGCNLRRVLEATRPDREFRYHNE